MNTRPKMRITRRRTYLRIVEVEDSAVENPACFTSERIFAWGNHFKVRPAIRMMPMIQAE
jgi:hypothetical protein